MKDYLLLVSKFAGVISALWIAGVFFSLISDSRPSLYGLGTAVTVHLVSVAAYIYAKRLPATQSER